MDSEGSDEDEGSITSSPLEGIHLELIFACRHGKSDRVEYLLSKGANKFCVDSHGWTPLHWGSANGHASVVIKLVSSFASSEGNRKLTYVNIRDSLSGWTPLHVICILYWYSHSNLIMFYIGGSSRWACRLHRSID